MSLLVIYFLYLPSHFPHPAPCGYKIVSTSVTLFLLKIFISTYSNPFQLKTEYFASPAVSNMLLESSLGKVDSVTAGFPHCSVDLSLFSLSLSPHASFLILLWPWWHLQPVVRHLPWGEDWPECSCPNPGLVFGTDHISPPVPHRVTLDYSAHKALQWIVRYPGLLRCPVLQPMLVWFFRLLEGLSASVIHALSHHLKKIVWPQKALRDPPHIWNRKSRPRQHTGPFCSSSFRLVAISLWLSFLTAQHKRAHLWALFHSQPLGEQESPWNYQIFKHQISQISWLDWLNATFYWKNIFLLQTLQAQTSIYFSLFLIEI